jgi:hypothetical protein
MKQKPTIRYVDTAKIDPDRAYLDKEGQLRFLILPRVEMTREELEKMYPSKKV